MTNENKNSTLGLVLILGSMAAIGPLSIDMYLPAFNDIAAALHTDRTQVGYTLTSYFLGIGVGQILLSPLSDRYGRKCPRTTALIVFALSGLAVPFTPQFHFFMIVRISMLLARYRGRCAIKEVGCDIV